MSPIDKYTTLELINDLIFEITKIIPKNWISKRSKTKGQIRQDILDRLLKQGSGYFADVKCKITNINHQYYNSDFKFAIKQLECWKNSLISNFNRKARSCLDLIDKYIKFNNLKEYSQQKWHWYNPELNVHYFDKNDTKEKSYWFGFLCADGYILSGNQDRKRYRIGIELNVKDINQLIKFCNAIGLDKKIIRKRIRSSRDGLKKYKSAYLNFECKPMWRALKNLDKFGSKSKIKKLPSFQSYEFSLAWLL